MSGSNSDVAIRSTVSTLSGFLIANTQNLTTLTSSQLQTLLNTYAILYQNMPIPLSAVSPDFESNKVENQTILSQVGGWKDIVTAATGETLLEMVATAQTYNQFSIERSLQEAMLSSALIPNSIYAIVSTLGQRAQRKIPASVSVTINGLTLTGNNLPTSIVIPPYTQFSINGVNYFNRYQISVPLNQTGNPTVSTTLYQGTVQTATLLSTGAPFQTFVIGNNDFSISNFDLMVVVGTNYYSSTNSLFQGLTQTSSNEVTPIGGLFSVGLWEFSGTSLVYREDTDPYGNLRISFGNNIYGYTPNANTNITVTYVTTLGSMGNTVVSGYAVGATIPFTSGPNTYNLQIVGTTTSAVAGGTDELSAFDYKNLSPGTFAAKLRPSTRVDYNSFALNYPGGGIIDANFLGQQDFAPNDPSQAMQMQAILLTEAGWTTNNSTAFTNWLYDYTGANLVITVINAVPVNFTVSATVYCQNQVDLNVIQSVLVAAVQYLCRLRPGIIGYSFYESDFTQVLTNSSSAVQYIDNLQVTVSGGSPGTDVIISKTAYQYANLQTVTLTMNVGSR